MAASTFFKIFPPPKFLVIRHVGLDISDDAITCLSYEGSPGSARLGAYATEDLPVGTIDGGDVKDAKKLTELLSNFQRKLHIRYVKASVPEEKTYLFQIEVPSADIRSIKQNIEFKLEENVPLSAADAVFYFDLIPSGKSGPLRVSVSVVPRTYIEHASALLSQAGMIPVAFEIVPKAIARAIVPLGSTETFLVAHIMKRKTGIYIFSGSVVSFASTVGWGSQTPPEAGEKPSAGLGREIAKVYTYWISRGDSSGVNRIVLVGRDALSYEDSLEGVIAGVSVPVSIAAIWENAFDLRRYVPLVSRDDSLTYGVAAGLALPS